jgi:hypothetical protein
MIKQNYILAILMIAISCTNAQTKKYFEGKITYKFSLVSKNEKIDTNYLKNIFGNGSTLIFKQGNYYHKFEGGLMEFDIYKKEDNKYYLKKRGNDTLFWYDCGSAGDKIEKFLFSAKKENILGVTCDELIIQYNDKTESHYYNPDSISINPDWFKRFTLDGENIIDEKEKSIYLKRKVENSYFLLTETATKVRRERIDDKIFEISPTAILSERK